MRSVLATILLCILIVPAAAHVRDRHHHRPVFAHRHLFVRVAHARLHRGEARHRAHRVYRRRLRRFSALAAPSAMPDAAASAPHSSLVQTALRYVGAHRDPSGYRGEWCGDFMGFVAKKVGYRVPSDYRLARAWAGAGRRVGGPVAGSVMVMPHHVGLVLKSAGRSVLLLSGNHGHKVGIGWYPVARAIAFVEPGRA